MSASAALRVIGRAAAGAAERPAGLADAAAGGAGRVLVAAGVAVVGGRARWDAYVAAACEMIEKTSTARAPWVAMPADDKNHARVEVLQAVRQTLRKKPG